MDRRDFLHPRNLASIAGPAIALASDIDDSAPSATEPVMLRFARQAMATTFEVILPFDTPSANEIAQSALDEIDRLKAQLTVYRETSEVSKLNAKAAHHPVHIERNLFDLLTLATRIHRETEGAFDISVGALIKAWGFYRRQGWVPSPEERTAVRERIGMQHVVLDDARQTVYFQRQGLELNLGSIGKGFALDRALPSPHRAAPINMLIHGGHSSVLALGNETPTAVGWTVGLTDPRRPERRRAFARLRNCAMATSAITHQHFEHDGKKLGHLLDPRTAWPAEGVLSATAIAPTAAEADALATAFFILGVDKTRAYCEAHPTIGAVMIVADAPHQLVVLGRAFEEVQILR